MGGSTVIAVSTIWYVHRFQDEEKRRMNAGVIADRERLARKREERAKSQEAAG